MFRQRCPVLANDRVAPGHHVIRLGSARIGRSARPGQFVQILCSDSTDPLLPRPFSFLTATEKDFSVLYQVVGRGTELLANTRRGAELWVLGPLGNGFSTGPRPIRSNSPDRTRSVLVGGGVGIPPLYHLAQKIRNKRNVHVFLGARNKSLLLCEKEFKKLKVDLHIATDDGSKGHKGLVTDLFDRTASVGLKDAYRTRSVASRIYACGPTPMLKAVSIIAQSAKVPCEVSVEVPMACGFGACLGCAVKTKRGYAIACKEGPVFAGADILWD